MSFPILCICQSQINYNQADASCFNSCDGLIDEISLINSGSSFFSLMDDSGSLLSVNHQFTMSEILQNTFQENSQDFHTYEISDLDNDSDDDIVFTTSWGLYWIENTGVRLHTKVE